MINKIIFILIFIFIGFNSYAQNTFNKRMDLGFHSSYLRGVVATDTCFYATGVMIDSIPSFFPGALFAKFDLEGNIEFTKLLKSSSKFIFTAFPSFQKVENNFMVGGQTIDSTFHGLFIIYDSNGDTLLFKEYESETTTLDFIHTIDIAHDLDGNFYLLNNIAYNNAQHMVIIKVDNLGNQLWYLPFGDDDFDNLSGSIHRTDDGNFIISSSKNNLNIHPQDFFSQIKISKIDTAGQIIWEYLTPQDKIRYIGANVIELDDGGFLIASGKGTEYANGLTHWVRWDKLFVKLNAQGEIEWEKEFKSLYPGGLINGINKLVIAPDESGYLGVSAAPEDLPGETSFTYRGWLGKISPNGDSLWTREYVVVDSDDNIHLLYDLKATSDGGYIMCGSAEDDTADTLQTQAWLLKVDEYGCLVPDCHLTPTEEPNTPILSLNIYPNPTSDYLNIHHYSSDYQIAQFRIVNVAGQVVKEFLASGNDLTTIVPVWIFPAGQYFLQYLVEGEIEGVEGFIITK